MSGKDDSFNGRCIHCGVICPDMETLRDHMKKCPYKIAREKAEERKQVEKTKNMTLEEKMKELGGLDYWKMENEKPNEYKIKRCVKCGNRILKGDDIYCKICGSTAMRIYDNNKDPYYSVGADISQEDSDLYED